MNVAEKGLLRAPAIEVLAGPGREDRIVKGSYVKLREERLKKKAREEAPPARSGERRGEAEGASGEVEYLPEFLR